MSSHDWHGRAAIKRRPSDGVVVLCYHRSTHHSTNDGALHIRFSDDNGATWTAEDTTLAGGAVSGFPMNPNDAAAGEDAGEPWLYVAPNGDLILHMWRVDYGTTANGTYQATSSDGGETWTAATGPIQFVGLSAAQNDLTFATDDDFVLDGVIYAGARRYTDATLATCRVLFVKSTDNGATWEYVADVTTTQDTQEIGFEYVGNNRIVGFIRSNNNNTVWKVSSDDLGATWAVAEADHMFAVSGRHRIYTRAHLQGDADWWNDDLLLMVGFELTTPGQSKGRINSLWLSKDAGEHWQGPEYLDVEYEDAGYGDIFYDATADRWKVVTYRGTQAAADLIQYDLSISGI